MNTASELRKLSSDDLSKELISLRREQLELRIQRSSEQVANTVKFRELRKDVARIKTVMNEKADT